MQPAGRYSRQLVEPVRKMKIQGVDQGAVGPVGGLHDIDCFLQIGEPGKAGKFQFNGESIAGRQIADLPA